MDQLLGDIGAGDLGVTHNAFSNTADQSENTGNNSSCRTYLREFIEKHTFKTGDYPEGFIGTVSAHMK